MICVGDSLSPLRIRDQVDLRFLCQLPAILKESRAIVLTSITRKYLYEKTLQAVQLEENDALKDRIRSEGTV
jgi:hypothetical protein